MEVQYRRISSQNDTMTSHENSLDVSHLVVDALPLIDAEPPAAIGVVVDDATHLLGELAPAVVVVDVEAVAASVLFQSRIVILPAGLVARPPTGALRSIGADGNYGIALKAAVR